MERHSAKWLTWSEAPEGMPVSSEVVQLARDPARTEAGAGRAAHAPPSVRRRFRRSCG